MEKRDKVSIVRGLFKVDKEIILDHILRDWKLLVDCHSDGFNVYNAVNLINSLRYWCMLFIMIETGRTWGDIAEECVKTFSEKNEAYGDSFAITIEKFGMVSALVRMDDKFNRLRNLMAGSKNRVEDESLLDTVFDVTNYLTMTLMEMED